MFRLKPQVLVLTTSCLVTATAAHAALTLTANKYDTPGVPGHHTYDVTATVEDGFFVAFGFFGESKDGREKGIHGKLFQKDALTGGALFTKASDDTGFLVDVSAGMQIFPSESEEKMQGVFAYTGTGGQRQAHRSWTFARVVTDAADQVEFLGELVAEKHYNDHTVGEIFDFEIDTLLSDILIGPAPELRGFPAPPLVPPVNDDLPERPPLELPKTIPKVDTCYSDFNCAVPRRENRFSIFMDPTLLSAYDNGELPFDRPSVFTAPVTQPPTSILGANLPIPEPSAAALSMIGMAAQFLLHRRNSQR